MGYEKSKDRYDSGWEFIGGNEMKKRGEGQVVAVSGEEVGVARVCLNAGNAVPSFRPKSTRRWHSQLNRLILLLLWVTTTHTNHSE